VSSIICPRRYANFHAGKILRRCDRTRDRRDLPHAVVETGHGKQMHALRSHLLADIFSKRAVDRLVRFRRRLECERQLLGFGNRNHRADDAAHQGKELDLACDQHLERVGIAARQLVVLGVDRGLDPAIGFPGYRLPHRGEVLVQRAAGGLVVILRKPVLGGKRRPDDQGRTGRSRAGQYRPPCPFPRHHILRSAS
jgi:hypothetical protein